ncbi:MAG: hydroxymethylbilane synthase [Planctomycetota bacterium]
MTEIDPNDSPAASENRCHEHPCQSIRIATRDSPLAMWQAEYVGRRLQDHGHEVEFVPLVSRGDVDMRPIDATRQVGVFTKRIQQALVDGEADIAVHSLKDLPTEADDRFVLAAVPPRGNVHDSLVAKDRRGIDQLRHGARIGTGSTRRRAQLMALRGDLIISPIRGNVQTRLSKLESGEFDAIVLAEAGLERLEMNDLPRKLISLDQMLPAPGQGALGIEVRSSDSTTRHAVEVLDDAATRACVTAERTALAGLDGGCLAPIAAFAQTTSESSSVKLTLRVIVLSADGTQRLSDQRDAQLPMAADDDPPSGSVDTSWMSDARQLGQDAAAALIDQGARNLIEANRDATT